MMAYDVRQAGSKLRKQEEKLHYQTKERKDINDEEGI